MLISLGITVNLLHASQDFQQGKTQEKMENQHYHLQSLHESL